MRDEQVKEITIGSRRYQLEKMGAMVASRVHGWLIYSAMILQQQQAKSSNGSSAPSAEELAAIPVQERADGTVSMLWIGASSVLSEDTYTKIQNYCLRCSKYYDADLSTWSPVVLSDGRWTAKDLEKDAQAVDELIRQALQFNISPFFVAGSEKTQSIPQTKTA